MSVTAEKARLDDSEPIELAVSVRTQLSSLRSACLVSVDRADVRSLTDVQFSPLGATQAHRMRARQRVRPRSPPLNFERRCVLASLEPSAINHPGKSTGASRKYFCHLLVRLFSSSSTLLRGASSTSSASLFFVLASLVQPRGTQRRRQWWVRALATLACCPAPAPPPVACGWGSGGRKGGVEASSADTGTASLPLISADNTAARRPLVQTFTFAAFLPRLSLKRNTRESMCSAKPTQHPPGPAICERISQISAASQLAAFLAFSKLRRSPSSNQCATAANGKLARHSIIR